MLSPPCPAADGIGGQLDQLEGLLQGRKQLAARRSQADHIARTLEQGAAHVALQLRNLF
ncbi:hypothetical protein D3C87_1768820 [compost metagenome]